MTKKEIIKNAEEAQERYNNLLNDCLNLKDDDVKKEVETIVYNLYRNCKSNRNKNSNKKTNYRIKLLSKSLSKEILSYEVDMIKDACDKLEYLFNQYKGIINEELKIKLQGELFEEINKLHNELEGFESEFCKFKNGIRYYKTNVEDEFKFYDYSEKDNGVLKGEIEFLKLMIKYDLVDFELKQKYEENRQKNLKEMRKKSIEETAKYFMLYLNISDTNQYNKITEIIDSAIGNLEMNEKQTRKDSEYKNYSLYLNEEKIDNGLFTSIGLAVEILEKKLSLEPGKYIVVCDQTGERKEVIIGNTVTDSNLLMKLNLTIQKILGDKKEITINDEIYIEHGNHQNTPFFVKYRLNNDSNQTQTYSWWSGRLLTKIYNEIMNYQEV